MIYFSEIVGKPVITTKGDYVGKLKDLIFLSQDQPLITKLVVQGREKNMLIIPVSDMKKMNSVVDVADDYHQTFLGENELYTNYNLLDQQIIDIKGNKVVRVNDVAIQDKPYLLIAGVDIGILGILRWFKLEKLFNAAVSKFTNPVSSRFLSWADLQPLELARGKVVLKKEQDKLERIRPEDLADHLEKMNLSRITKVLNVMDEKFAAEVIGNLNISYQQSLFKHFEVNKAKKIIELIDPDEAVDILLSLSEVKRTQIIKALSPEKQKEIEFLLSLSKTPIGGLVTSEFLTTSSQDTVQNIKTAIREKTQDYSFFNYVYVTNTDYQLVGVFNLHELLLQPNDMQAYKFMRQNIVTIHLGTPKELAIKKMLKYRIEALPVLDKNKKMLGIVTFDDLAESVLKHLEIP